MRKILIVAAVVSVAAISVFLALGAPPAQSERGIESTVSRVVDGDTIQLANGDVVRLIGIDAPEKDHPYSDEVVDQLRILEGKTVRMEKDRTNTDRYGRYLRYVFLGDKFVNLELVRDGLAYAYVVNPDKKYESEFLEAEALARSSKSGIWRTSEHSECISLGEFRYNAAGEDDKNVNGEYFVVKNGCDHAISMSGWKARNSYMSFPIPEVAMPQGSEVKIHSGFGNVTSSAAFLSSDRPIWNNKGDTIYLRDGAGDIVFSKSYKNQ